MTRYVSETLTLGMRSPAQVGFARTETASAMLRFALFDVSMWFYASNRVILSEARDRPSPLDLTA